MLKNTLPVPENYIRKVLADDRTSNSYNKIINGNCSRIYFVILYSNWEEMTALQKIQLIDLENLEINL